MNLWSVVVLFCVALGLVACVSSAESPEGGGDGAVTLTSPVTARLNVLTTVSPITSIAENIGGDRIDLQGIVPEGVNSHTFEPAPSLAVSIAAADLIIINGLFLEQPTLELAEANRRDDAVLLMLGDNTITREEWAFDFSFPESEGHPNPHLWPNPMHSLKYAELIQEQLIELDPTNIQYYSDNLASFRQRIEVLDEAIRTATETVPPQNRKLLTYHDSWAYFAQRYGWEVLGAVQPADFSEPSAREVVDLIDQIRANQLPAVFGSEVFPSPVLETIARESGATYIDELRDDDLPGAPGDPRHSYLGLMVQNLEIMVTALGGNAEALAAVDTSPVYLGNSAAEYPQ